MKKIFAYILVILGSFLEVFYNSYRYHQDGIPLAICIIIGLALNIFLLVCVMEKRPVLATMLIIFSILSTSSGQTFALINKDKIEMQAEVNPEKERIETENKKLIKERDEINQQIAETVKTLEDRYTWKNTLASAEERKKEIKTALEDNKKSLEKAEQKGESGKETIYSLYSRLLNDLVSVDLMKVILHTILSVFISMMAPTGITALEKEGVGKHSKVCRDAPEVVKMETSDWFRWFYREKRYGREKVPPVARMKEYAYIAGKEWDEALHADLMEKCTQAGIITEKGTISGTEEEAQKTLENSEKKSKNE